MSCYVFVGDSLTAAGRVRTRPDDLGHGWVAEVAARLQRADPAARVVNLGVPGDRAADVRDRVGADLAAAGVLVPDVVVTLAVGVNDVRRAHLDGEAFDVRAFARTYAAVLPRVVAPVPGGRVRLVLVEPVLAPVDAAQAGWTDDLRDVCEVVANVAAANGAPLVRVRETFAGAVATTATTDGVHPTPVGHRLLADAWWEAAGQVPGLLPPARDGVPDRPRWWDRLRSPRAGG